VDYITKNNNSKVQLSTLNERINNGQKLYIAAWGFEILAAIIGILVAVVTGITAYEGFSAMSSDGEISYEQWSDVILGFVPFLMVALAEILKIPIAYLVYINRSIITKIVFSLILAGLTFITFETVVSGFERQFSNITSKVRGPADEMNRNLTELATLENSISKDKLLNETSVSKMYSDSRADARKKSTNVIKDIDKQILDIQANNSGPIGSRLKLKEESLDRLIGQRDTEIERLMSNSSSMQKGLDKEREVIKDALRNKNSRLDKNMEIINRPDAGLCIFGACPTAKKENVSLLVEISKLESNLSNIKFNLNQEIEKVNKKYRSRIDNNQSEVDKYRSNLLETSSNNLQIDGLNAQKVQTHKELQEKLKEIDARENSKLEDLSNINVKIKEDQSRVGYLRDEIIQLNKEVGKYESLTQIYRFTKYYLNFIQEPICLEYEKFNPNLSTEKSLLSKWLGIDGKDLECINWSETKEITAADVTMEDVSKVSFIWFGSLAFLVSVMGVVLAFGAFILKYPNQKFKGREDSRWSLTRSIRMIFAASFKKLRKPKKVVEVTKIVETIKEVPVDKVVFQEVPVEVVRKEVIHTPIYTNDPDLLKFGTTKIKDVLKNEDDKEDEK